MALIICSELYTSEVLNSYREYTGLRVVGRIQDMFKDRHRQMSLPTLQQYVGRQFVQQNEEINVLRVKLS